MTNTRVNPYITCKTNPNHKRVIARQKKERKFKKFGLNAILLSMIFLAFLLYTIFSSGWQSFLKTEILLEIDLKKHISSEAISADDLNKLKYRKIINQGLKDTFPEVKGRRNLIRLYSLVSRNSYLTIKENLSEAIKNNEDINLSNYRVWVPASSNIDMLEKGKINESSISKRSKVSKADLENIIKLRELGKIRKVFNSSFLSSGDSREAELAGALGSIKGSIFVILICMLCSLPLGVAAAIYLEEFAPRNRITTLIEISVNNLAAIPSIVYGLLGLAIYINFFGIQRSSPLAGGLTLALLVLPVIIIATRNSLSSVPPSIKDAARGLGASKMQVLFHHTLPLALPGIMTGSILSIARALGETAPLLMIGMVAFVKDIPQTINDPSTALPVQIYIWSDLPEQGFAEKTSGAIIILLLFLISANAIAVYLRKKFEYKW